MPSNGSFVVTAGVDDINTGARFPRRQFVGSLWDHHWPTGLRVMGGDGAEWTVGKFWYKCPRRPSLDCWRLCIVSDAYIIYPVDRYGNYTKKRRRTKKR